jgi:hypothetical protein
MSLDEEFNAGSELLVKNLTIKDLHTRLEEVEEYAKKLEGLNVKLVLACADQRKRAEEAERECGVHVKATKDALATVKEKDAELQKAEKLLDSLIRQAHGEWYMVGTPVQAEEIAKFLYGSL